MQEFPKFIISQPLKDQAEERFSVAFDRLEKAYIRLCSIPELTIPSNIKDCTHEWLNSLIDNIVKEISGQLTLTQEMKDTAVAKWLKVKERASGQITIIQEFINKYPDAVITTEGMNTDVTNCKDIIMSLAKVETPDGCEEHHKLCIAAADAVKRLKEFEQEHGMNFHRDDFIEFAKDAELLIQAWITQQEINKFKL